MYNTYTTSKTAYCNFWCESGINYLLSIGTSKNKTMFCGLTMVNFDGLIQTQVMVRLSQGKWVAFILGKF